MTIILLGMSPCRGIRPNKKVSVFQVKGLKILGRVGAHVFLNKNSCKNIILCILKGILPFKMHEFIYFTENLIFFQVSPVDLGRVGLP